MSDGASEPAGADLEAAEESATAAAAVDRESDRGPRDRSAGDEASALSASVAPTLGMAVCYLVTVVGGLALAPEAAARGLVLFENPDSVGNVGVFGAIVLGFTGVFVAAFRFGKGLELIRALLAVAFGSLVAAAVVLATGVGDVFVENPALAGLPSEPISVAITLATAIALWYYPEWYVLDLIAIVAGTAAIAMLGLSFGPLPIVVLLVVWAAYDAYAVYVSGHMKDVAAGAGSLKLPMVYVVPTERGYSLRESGLDLGLDDESARDGTADAETDGGAVARGDASEGEVDADGNGADRSSRPAMILGLGDALIPGMLAVSAAHYLDGATIVPFLSLNAPALGALGGGVVGLGALVVVLHRFEGAHAGLPPLNAGVLGGYLLGALVAGIPLTAALGL